MSAELRYKLLFEAKLEIQEIEEKHKKLVNKLAHDLQLLGFAERKRKITKLEREIQNKIKKLVESI